MIRVLSSFLVALSLTAAALSQPTLIVSGLKMPESVAVGFGGKMYVSCIGEFGKDGDGAILRIENGKALPFVAGLNDPKGLTIHQQWMFVTDKDRVVRIDAKGKTQEFVAATAFPRKPIFLNDITADPESGTLYVVDSGDHKGAGGAVFRITPQGKATLVVDAKDVPGMNTPNGALLDGQSHLLVADWGNGNLFRVKLADKSVEKIAEGMDGADGLCWDYHGRLFISSWKTGKVFSIPRPGVAPILIAEGFTNAADICFDPANKQILVPDMKGGTLSAVAIKIPGYEIDESPLPLKTEIAFPNLQWTGWKGETDSGKPNPLRPILLTHAGDDSNRVFVPTQHGVIHSFPNDQKATQTTIFMDIQDRVKYSDASNEEGFLGLAFHPRFKDNGEFFVFYTTKHAKLTNIVSRFRVMKDDPTRGDPASEEQLIKFEKPYWNHDGGTICFGPDGYLYITHGDGGAANDPHDNGQKMNTWLGKVLRIDVNTKSAGKNYGIPKDNPFIDKPGACHEIWAYGLRNLWRMAFDRETGKLWAGEVGQNLWEEIVIIERGGNYGWNRRESLHPFGPKGMGHNKEMIEPIWEYHHDIGKSITGGCVYRGPRLPDLAGHYLYADYVSGRIWALKYDEAKSRVTANRPIADKSVPIFSFGEDEKGEVYLLTSTTSGRGIFWLAK